MKCLGRFILILFYLSIIQWHHDVQAQVTLLSQTSLSGRSSDVWGFVDDNDVEYAIIGDYTHARIYSLENATNPILRSSIAGATTDWHDFKSFGNRIYGVKDVNGSDGILIVNMSNAPSMISSYYFNPVLSVSGQTQNINQCHNLYIDEDQGYMYLAGCQVGNGGVLIFDLNATPGAPVMVGYADNRYAHDVYVRDNLMYTSDIYNGIFTIYDVSNKSNPIELGSHATTYNFTHNSWLSDDGQTLFTTDERGHAFVGSYDVSDPSDIKELDRFRPLATQGSGVIPHNVHVLDDYLVLSYYRDGLIIVDASQPDNLIEVASYDTYPGMGYGFQGAWGAYPFLPSGNVLVGDINGGLFVFDVNYQRACYLRGRISDMLTNQSLPNTKVTLLTSTPVVEYSKNTGLYASGIATSGTYQVEINHPDYYVDTVTVVLNNGVTTILDHALRPRPCRDSWVLTGIHNTAVYEAKGDITIVGLVPDQVQLTLNAFNSTTILPNFEVELGAELNVLISGCTP